MYNKIEDLGFIKIPTFTVAETYTLDIGRGRYLSLTSSGTPNEMIFICQTSKDDKKVVEDVVCIHNYDYDGNITYEKIARLVSLLTSDGCLRHKKEK